MIYETGYEYYTENIIQSFLGKLKAEGYFVHDSETEYHGWVKLVGKKRPLYRCTIQDGRYNYWLDAIGLHINIDCEVRDDYAIRGLAYAMGKEPMKVMGGGTTCRVSLADGQKEDLKHWNN